MNEVLCNKRSWAYLQVSFEVLFYLMKVLNRVMVQNIEVVLG
jgi:hypothetical protein